MKLSILSYLCSSMRSVVRLRKSALVCLAIFFLSCPLVAQCIVICYATNDNVQITNWAGFWDSMMVYWTYTWTETWTWDCSPEGACTTSCAICEKDALDKSTDGTNYTQVAVSTGNGTAAACTVGNTDVYNVSINLYRSTYYRFRWMSKSLNGTNSCDSLLWNLDFTKTFQTGPGL